MKHLVSRIVLVLALASGCGHGPGGAPDAAASGDAGEAGPSLPTPRLIAPLSTAFVTQQRPTLRWALGEGSGTPVVDLCRDRACAQPLAIATQVASDGQSAVPEAALPPGWVYWRVRTVAGARVATSRTWQFWVGRSSASTPVDTSGGTVLDINGDGYADFLVGAPDVSAVHLYLGSETASAIEWNGDAPAARIELLTLDPPNSRFGSSVANLGDVNGDGYGDFLIACPGCGSAYLYLGSAAPRADDWNGIAPIKRITLAPPPAAGFGAQLASAGDVDGDGFADFLVAGGDSTSYNNPAAVWLFLGSATPSGDDWSASASTRRIELQGPEPMFGFSMYGAALAGAGDVNGDGYADFAVGDWESNTAYVYLGSAMPGAQTWNGASPVQRLDVTAPDGVRSAFGVSVASAGDTNGDGYTDLLIGDAGPGTGLGAAHLYLGSATLSARGWSQAESAARVDLTSPEGANADYAGTLASAGDINGDGYADFLVGADGAGVVHVYLGAAQAGAAAWNGALAPQRIDLTSPTGAAARFGIAMAGAGDVNGDGHDDIVVGADAAADRSASGAAYLYLGPSSVDDPRWTGVTAAMRRDLTGPDGPGAHFGRSVAIDRAHDAPCMRAAR